MSQNSDKPIGGLRANRSSFRHINGATRRVLTQLHQELSPVDRLEDDLCESAAEAETLYRRVARAKARWLKRIMYGSIANSTEKCFAYAVADHLNCVTLDAWPGQVRLAELLGFKCTKTVDRAARGLEKLEVLIVKRSSRDQRRYAPVFLPGDEDKDVRGTRQLSATAKDMNVHESLLLIHINTSAPTKRTPESGVCGLNNEARYRKSQRGMLEVQIAAALGDDGIEILSRLGAIDDTIIDRLCRAYAVGALRERELIATRLAAEQVR